MAKFLICQIFDCVFNTGSILIELPDLLFRDQVGFRDHGLGVHVVLALAGAAALGAAVFRIPGTAYYYATARPENFASG